ncbi:protein lingerer [Anopheles aquasalis]|uniref:protein lingerer n=1 Tax=Anopheles aquasalis TaxID=42839 RepID=UPI00215ABDC4|nr:protein lingerer [Anopheles aquasalis]
MCAATAPVTVKQERHDEAEIKEMAEKIMEVHKQQIAKAAATATLQQQQQILPGAAAGTAGVRTGAGMLAAGAAGGTQAGATANGVVAAATAAAAAAAAAAGGQANILNYLTRKPSANTTAAANNNGAATVGMHLGTGAGAVSQNGTAKGAGGVGGGTLDGGSPEVCDEESQKGHFGWETFPNKTYIPYILREQERYCSVRMLETRLLGKYLNYLHQDIYTCTCVKSYYITETESKLLNEINAKHSDMYFGREMFTVNDGVVRLTDAHKFYRFLDVCYHKLMMGCSTPNDKCGFIRINKESVVPYTVRDGQKMVPLFYFEGETDNLRLKADNLSGWDLSYLKFCCKVQGIRNELFASDSVAVISLTDIKGYFPPGTEFEDYWPSKVVDSQLLSGSKSNNTVHWTRQPAHAPQKTSGAMHGGGGGGGGSQGRKAANNSNSSSNNNNSNSNAYQALPTQANLAKSNLQMNSITAAAVQALSNNWNLVNGNHGNILSQQEQLLRISQAQQTAQAQAQIRSMQFQQYSSYLNSALSMAPRGSQNQAVPPPLVRSQAAHLSNVGGGGCGVGGASGASAGGGGIGGGSVSGAGGGGGGAARSTSTSNPLPYLNPALSIFATSSSPNGTVNMSRLNHQQISELTTSPGGGSRESLLSANAFGGLSLGRNVTITPTSVNSSSSGGSGGSGGGNSYQRGTAGGGQTKSGAYYNNSSSHNQSGVPVAYPKNPPVSITALPVGSPTRASPKGVQARQPPPALIPVQGNDGGGGGGGASVQLPYAQNAVDLVTQLTAMLGSDKLEMIQDLLQDMGVGGAIGQARERSTSHLTTPSSYRDSNTTGSGSAGSSSSVIVHDGGSRRGGGGGSRVDEYARNQQSVIKSAIGSNGNGGSGSYAYRGQAGPGTLDVIDLSSSPRSNMAGATLSQQHQQQLQQAAAAQQQAVQQQQQQQQSQSSGGSGSKRSASGSSGHSGGSSRSSTIISSSSGGGGGSSGGSITSNNSYRNAASVSVLQQLQQQQQAAAAAAAVAAAAAAVVGSVGDTPRNLTIIPELNIGVTPYKPYEVVKKPVENKVIYCVNKTPYRHNEYLMTIFDLKDVFFPYVSVEMCRRVLTALEINLFIGNSLQYQALLEAGRTNVDKMPMVQVTDVMTYMPQLQYMVRSQIQDTPASKRARIS